MRCIQNGVKRNIFLDKYTVVVQSCFKIQYMTKLPLVIVNFNLCVINFMISDFVHPSIMRPVREKKKRKKRRRRRKRKRKKKKK